MSTVSVGPARPAAVVKISAASAVAARLHDYAELFKLRVTSLVVMSAWCGFYLASMRSGAPSLSWAMLHALLGIGLVAGGTAAMNQVVERDLDVLMRRTARRPLPTNHMSVAHATIVGVAAIVGGIIYLALATNLLTGALTALTSALYLGAYTPLKRVSTWCTFIGAFPGALPPVLGWTAVRNSLGWEPLVLFGIVFLWQFPHFHSIAWLYREDYDRASIRMLPVVERDGRSTIHQIIAYSLLLIPVSVAPLWLHMSGGIYAVSAVVLGGAFLWFGLRLANLHLAPTVSRSKPRARHLLQASVFYLPLLFAIMMLNAK